MDLFPFDTVRKKQDQLISEAEEAIQEGKNLVAHAPTGLGKTAATITPALESAVREDEKVFFLTPRHSQHQIAIETVRRMNEKHGEDIVSVDLIGKDHLCEADSATRAGEGPDCPRHDDTFEENHELTEKAKQRVREVRSKALTAEEVKARCQDVCPYQVLMHATKSADLVVADYFHVFHPGVRDIVFESADVEIEDSILIVDEAHNLPSRTRSLFTYSLSMPQLDSAITEAEKFGYYQEQENLDQLKRVLRNLGIEKLSQEDHEAEVEKKEFMDSIDSFYSYKELKVDLDAVADEVQEEQEKSHCAAIAEFLDQWEGEDQGFFRCVKRTRSSGGNRYIQLKYSCLNPQISTRSPLNGSKSSIMMSGTLTPQEMYVDLLGLEDTRTVAFDSPFPEENQMDLVIPTLTTKYEERDDSMLQKYAWYLSKSFEAVDGNCGVFFPSYQMMHQVHELLAERTDRKIFVEEQGMDKRKKQEILDDFAARKEHGDSVLLGVAAGSFGEGVDYPGEVLKGVFIVGLPLRRPDLETKALIDYYDEKFGSGWEYAYSFPAMNRAIQAAGRCIRSEDDRGVIVFMDKRYNWSNYRKVFPPGHDMKETRAPWQEIEEFFG
ncbi:MAG: ATP-dependent DNA helicase [Candidatus Nanohaloarchaea archaeon]